MTTPTKSVLVIDDDDDIRAVLEIILRLEGYEAMSSADGVAALALIDAGSTPSVIVLDLMMPRMDGREFLRRLRSRAEFNMVPVVLLSGDARACDTAGEAGAQDCLVKPVDIDTIVGAVNRLAHPSA